MTPWSITFGFLFPVLYISASSVRERWRGRMNLEPADQQSFLSSLGAGVSLGIFMVLFQASFTVIKNALPAYNGGGFPLDGLHADIDRMLHGGIDPWRFFEPLIASGPVLQAMEFNYGLLWFLFNYGFLFLVLVSPSLAHLRRRYFYAFALTWILVGNVFAGLFLSAGPAFYGAVTGDAHRFADLVALLGDPHGRLALGGDLPELPLDHACLGQ